MTIKGFFEDKRYIILSTLLVTVFLAFFLIVLKIQWEIIVVVIVSVLLLFFIMMVVEFSRRYQFYNEVAMNLAALDQKYLITELLPNSGFLDGDILIETLQISNKSMSDYVSAYRHSQDDYMNYLDLWIHEVKTPLAAIDLIASNTNTREMKEILEETTKVENYLEQVLYYARSSSLEKDYIIQKVRLEDSVRKVIKNLSATFIQKRVQLQLESLDVDVFSDAKWLEYILKQIIDNALKYVKAGEGMITISSETHDQSVSLHIKDNGPGIADSDIRRVFERGFTGQTGRFHQQATGMGLYLVKILGDKLYLDISIKSEQGTHVTITFPKSDMMFQ